MGCARDPRIEVNASLAEGWAIMLVGAMNRAAALRWHSTTASQALEGGAAMVERRSPGPRMERALVPTP
jgi:hypothetical protein